MVVFFALLLGELFNRPPVALYCIPIAPTLRLGFGWSEGGQQEAVDARKTTLQVSLLPSLIRRASQSYLSSPESSSSVLPSIQLYTTHHPHRSASPPLSSAQFRPFLTLLTAPSFRPYFAFEFSALPHSKLPCFPRPHPARLLTTSQPHAHFYASRETAAKNLSHHCEIYRRHPTLTRHNYVSTPPPSSNPSALSCLPASGPHDSSSS